MSVDLEPGVLHLFGKRTNTPEDDKAIELFHRQIRVPQYLDLDSMTICREAGLLCVSIAKSPPAP